MPKDNFVHFTSKCAQLSAHYSTYHICKHSVSNHKASEYGGCLGPFSSTLLPSASTLLPFHFHHTSTQLPIYFHFTSILSAHARSCKYGVVLQSQTLYQTVKGLALREHGMSCRWLYLFPSHLFYCSIVITMLGAESRIF